MCNGSPAEGDRSAVRSIAGREVLVGERARVRPVWLVVVGVVSALIAAPVGAVAATQLVKISGPSGTVAVVDPAKRLQVAESSPKAFFDTGFLEVDTAGGCRTLFHVPATKALIVTQVDVDVRTSPTFDANHAVVMAAQASCLGGFVFIDQPHRLGSELSTLQPGLPVPAGSTISAEAIGTGLTTEIELRGYFVPKSAVS